MQASTAAATKKAYRSDWDRFAAWAGAGGFPPLPAPPPCSRTTSPRPPREQTGVGKWRYAPATLTRWVASINQVHTAAGLDAARPVRDGPPGAVRDPPDPGHPAEPARAAAAGRHPHPDDLDRRDRPGGWPAGVAARRDTALLLMGFAGAHRRSELVALTLADVTLHAHGRPACAAAAVEDRPGGPRHGEGPAVRAGPGDLPALRLRPVAAGPARRGTPHPDGAGRRAVLPVLRRQAAITAVTGGGEEGREEEPVLHCCRSTRLAGTGRPGPGVVPDGAQDRRHRRPGDVRRRDRRDDPAPRRPGRVHGPAQTQQLGGHSLRAGFVTEAFRAGADAHAIMRQTGHRSPVMLEVYAREHAPLVGNAVTRLGL